MRLIYSFYIYSLVILLALPLAALLTLIPSLSYRRKLTSGVCKTIFFMSGIRLKLTGLENLPTEECIVIANHSSYLDGLLLMAVLPPRFSFVIKREVTTIPVLHLVLRRIQSHFVERANRATAAQHLKKLIRYAADGNSLGVFPEGTFRVETGLRSFQKGAFAVAHKTNHSLVPVFIHGARQALPAEEWKITRTPIQIHIQKPVLNPAKYLSVDVLKDEMHQLFYENVGHL